MPPRPLTQDRQSLTPETLASLHAKGFDRPWTASDFAGLLDQQGMQLATAPGGFALARVVLDEAEVLTIVTDPARRGQGIATGVLRALLTQVAEHGATRVFLEVADDNHAARALYSAAGFREVGLRRGYYPRPEQPSVDAILLSRDL